MLVENKFFYISIPRCASTSFHYSCILNNLDVQFVTKTINSSNKQTDLKNVKLENLMDHIKHGHESLNDLQKKFGSHYPIISIKRDRYDRFYSLLKHVIYDTERIGAYDVSDFLKKINLDNLFFFSKDDLINKKNRVDKINEFLLENKLIKKKVGLIDTTIDVGESIEEKRKKTDSYIVNVFEILITPISNYHQHNKDIIWFDFNNLSDLEKWVSDTLGFEFKLKKTNSSKHVNCNLQMDGEFIKRYNNIYDYYDFTKSNKTIL